jgi:hypothetical protein
MSTHYWSLLPNARNQMLRTIEDAELDPRDFEWSETRGSRREPGSTRLSYNPAEDSFFQLTPQRDSEVWGVRFSPGAVIRVEATLALSWPRAAYLFAEWLRNIKTQAAEPDLWARIIADARETVVSGDYGSPANNDKFRPEETEVIFIRIEQVRANLLGSGLNEEQARVVSERLDYLTEATRRLGRFDWRGAALGVAFDIAVAVAFDPEQAQRLLNAILGTAQRLLSGG